MKKNYLIILILLTTTSLFSATITVSNNNDTGSGSLRNAIANATNGDILVFNNSLSNQTIILASTLNIPISKNLTIDGLSATNLTISGNNLVRIFLLSSTSVNPTSLTLKNLRLINGLTNENGAAVKSEHRGILNISNCSFIGNNAHEGGSAIFSAFEGSANIQNCNFSNNVSTLLNNESGSTVFLFGPNSQVVKNCNFNNNKGINGGAIHGLNAPLLIEDCNFIGNLTTDAVFGTGQAPEFLRGFGGAIYTDRATPGPPSVTLGSIILRRCKFENNKGRSEGGACYLYTDPTDNVLIEDCNFNNNEVLGLPGGSSSSAGGAISQMNDSKNLGFVLRNSTFSNNKAIENGGAVRVFWADSKIENCTFFNNRSELTVSNGYSANGGALAFFSIANSNVEVTNSAFAQNYAGWVGGAILGDPSVKIKNNIFFNNTAGNGGNTWQIQQHSSDEMTDLGGNLQFPNKYTNNSNDYNVSSSVTIADAQLIALANNGGFTPTMAIPVTSPAVNFGVTCATSPQKDQRGATRIGVCDSGPFEYNGVVVTSINSIASNNKLKFYPNPSNDGIFFIELPKEISEDKIKLELYSIEGKLIYKNLLFDHNFSFTVPQKGFYILKVLTNESSFTNKIIFE